MSRQCTCLGTNENCGRCNGLGYVDWGDEAQTSEPPPGPPAVDMSVVATPSVRNPSGAPNAERPKVVVVELPHSFAVGCLYCSLMFNSNEQREVHIQAEHIADGGDTSAQALAKPLVRIKGAVFDRSALRRAEQRRIKTMPGPLKRKLRASGKLPPVPESAAKCALRHPVKSSRAVKTAKLKSTRVKCPDCPNYMPASSLQKHRRNKHHRRDGGAIGVAAKVQDARHPHKVAVDETSDGLFGEADNSREERRLDGSRDYAEFREDGRFGSHSSYDDFDDESAP
jgi:hypothetical protein